MLILDALLRMDACDGGFVLLQAWRRDLRSIDYLIS